ncbi:MAG: hypothetical protein NC452_17655 [Eubacterium sp.]|nr:hypothetical protein [Eubacterium sp.]
MLNSKKIISAVLALSMVAATPLIAYAEGADRTPATIEYSTNNERSINWTYTSVVAASFGIDGQYGNCVGSYELYSDMKSIVTVTLMKSKDAISWSAVESWDTTNYTYSPSSIVKTSTNKLTHGYYYMSHTQVQVLDSNGKALETTSVFSNYEYYA